MGWGGGGTKSPAQNLKQNDSPIQAIVHYII